MVLWRSAPEGGATLGATASMVPLHQHTVVENGVVAADWKQYNSETTTPVDAPGSYATSEDHFYERNSSSGSKLHKRATAAVPTPIDAEPPDSADTSVDSDTASLPPTAVIAAVSSSSSVRPSPHLHSLPLSPSQYISNSSDNNLNSNSSSSADGGGGYSRSKKRKASTAAANSSSSSSAAGAATSDSRDGSGDNNDNTNNSSGSNNNSNDDNGDDGADHAADEENDNTPAIVWNPQTMQSTCEFTHTIFEYARKRDSGCKKAEYSAITQDNLGNRWRLIIYVNGNGRASNHHLSLFLQVADADDLPFGWKKAVSYVLTLEHPTMPSLSYAKRNPDKTFKLCPKAIDWGWSQFITSDRIQQDGFVADDALTVRAQVTVKSSSVAIDEEDAELYLKCAVEEGDAKSVKQCLDHGASVNCQFKDDLYTPLHTACSSGITTGSMEVLNLLLAEGADGNACNKWRETPLLIAANNGHRAAVEALLRHGADPSLCSEAGWSALTFAAHKGFDDIVGLLLRAGAPVNCPVTEDASTPLHKACAGSKPGHLAAVKLLLEANADVLALNKWRETPLLTAANHGQAGAVQALLAADADPCKCTDTGWSPLSIAAYKGHDECVRLLLEEGAPTEEDDPTLSALLQAATKGLPDTVELLLSHGADHNVTTKKGDTALSILVEQNLIDAAVEMVTEYNASISRCSRDRKKVQRARLLINLRMKQMEREGKDGEDGTCDEESDAESARSNIAQHIGNGASGDDTPDSGKKKKKGKNDSESAEELARKAEEALLLELEKEDQLAKEEDAKAASKQAKKKKQKERQRQQKLKEENERREKEEREAKERERIRMEKEEKQRKEREERLKAEREQEMREMLEREQALAAKRRERDEREKREMEKEADQRASGSLSPSESRTRFSEKRVKQQKPKRAVTDPTPNRKIVSPKGAKKPAVPLAGNRRWETAAKQQQQQQRMNQQGQQQRKSSVSSGPNEESPSLPSLPLMSRSSKEPAAAKRILSPRLSQPPPAESSSSALLGSLPTKESETQTQSPETVSSMNGTSVAGLLFTASTLEHPAIALFRREKVTELLKMCEQFLNLVGEQTVQRVLYRWIVRASHGKTVYSDPIIPSWLDSDQLVAYFQRQFIAESRRRSRRGIVGPSMESLKEAGSAVAFFCQNCATQVKEFRQRIDEQLPPDWTDSALGMTTSDGPLSGGARVVALSWANRAQTLVSSSTLATLRERHIGPPSRFLAAVFVTKIWYETTQMIVADTEMDFRLPPDTQACLSVEAGVTAELWSDPFSALSTNVFWGRFETVDAFFGGQKPFGKEEKGSEEVLVRHGGSIAAILPMDTMVASLYVQKMVDILDDASLLGFPVSFAVFVNAECFHDLPSDPSVENLRSLDPRLGDEQISYIRRAEVLPAGQHTFCAGQGTGDIMRSSSASLFVVLQNAPGSIRYSINDISFSRILSSMSNGPAHSVPTISTSIGLAHEYPPLLPEVGYFDGLAEPLSPDAQRGTTHAGFGSIGVNPLTNTLSPVSEGGARGTRRGRLFELVEDADEDHQQNDDIIISGMLNNLDLGLFTDANVGSDNVDIEAISLMGIGGPPSQLLRNSANSHPRQLG